MSVIYGLVVLVIGVLMVIKADAFFHMFGEIPWAEANLRGGSSQFYKFLGLVVCAIGILWATGLIQGIVIALLTPLFGSLK